MMFAVGVGVSVGVGVGVAPVDCLSETVGWIKFSNFCSVCTQLFQSHPEKQLPNRERTRSPSETKS